MTTTEQRLTLRLDATVDAALTALVAAGAPNRTAAARQAILDAAKAARSAELRAWAEKVGNDPAEQALARRIQADFAADEHDAWAQDRSTAGEVR